MRTKSRLLGAFVRTKDQMMSMVYEISDGSNQGIGFGHSDSASPFGLGQSDPAAILFGLGQSDPAVILVGHGQGDSASLFGFGQGDSAVLFGLGQSDPAAIIFGFGQGDSATIQIRPWRFGHPVRIRP